MILYLDTSALVKLYVEETDSEEVRSAVGDSRVVAVSEICYVEARSALARKEREGVISGNEHDEIVEQLDLDFKEIYLLRRLTGEIVVRAGNLTREHALRAYDAVHLAAALALREEARGIPEESEQYRVSLMTYDGDLTSASRKEDLLHDRDASRSDK